jgi:segregation and condensation protein B
VDFLQNHIEALIFCSPSPIKLADIKACLSEMFNADVPEEDITGAIERLEEKFKSDDFSFQLFRTAGGFQFLTKPAYQTSIGIMLKQQSKKRLSTSAMETLSIIAYKQPISKTEIENIRGVNCDYAVQKLLDKSLIEITGKAETIGRPMLYGTTAKFMEYFGINDLAELPTPKDFTTTEINSIGENPDLKEPDAQV